MTQVYIGDINVEHGGTWYTTPDNEDFKQDYAECTSVIDVGCCIDSIKSDYPLWVVESGSIYMPWDECRERLSIVGAEMLMNGDIDDNGTILANNSLEHWLCYAYVCQAYFGIEQGEQTWLSYDIELTNDEPDSITVEIIEEGTLSQWLLDNYGVETS